MTSHDGQDLKALGVDESYFSKVYQDGFLRQTGKIALQAVHTPSKATSTPKVLRALSLSKLFTIKGAEEASYDKGRAATSPCDEIESL